MEDNTKNIMIVECSRCDNKDENERGLLIMNGWYLNDEEFPCMGIMCPACYSEMVNGERRDYHYFQ